MMQLMCLALLQFSMLCGLFLYIAKPHTGTTSIGTSL